MSSPLKRSNVLKVGDTKIVEVSLMIPLQNTKDKYIYIGSRIFLDGAPTENMLFYVEEYFRIQPNGTFFIQLWKDSLNMTMREDHFLQVG